MNIKRIVSTGLIAASLAVATFGAGSIVSAATPQPFGLNCNNVRLGFTNTCTYRATADDSFRVTTSNNAVFAPFSDQTFGGQGEFLISGERLGGVTVCVFSNDGFTRTCDSLEVVR
jgi:hypothetical protein